MGSLIADLNLIGSIIPLARPEFKFKVQFLNLFMKTNHQKTRE